MIKPEKSISLRCDCGCSTVVFEKWVFDFPEENTASYSISFQDDSLHSDHNTLAGRIKRAFRILLGKPIYYAEVSGDAPEFEQFFSEAIDTVRSEVNVA